MADWQKHDPASMAWTGAGEGVEQRSISAALTMFRLSGGSAITLEAGSLLLVDDGALRVAGLGEAVRGDLAWLVEPAQVDAEDGASFYCLSVDPGIGPGASTLIESRHFDWQEFEDPAGRPTQPVQVLMEGDLAILRTRFVPEYTAGEHWHDFDTWYFITDGNMRFGHEGWYETGQVRQVRGGFSYGPEEPGDSGVEFVLVSVGGPVNLHWADLEPAPNGVLA